MNQEILDAPETDYKKKNYSHKIKDGLPILILTIIVLYSLYMFATTNNTLTLPKIIGISGVLLAALIYFVFGKQLGILIFSFTLFLSIFGIVKFTTTYTTFSIFGLTFPPLSTFLFILSVYWYREQLKDSLDRFKKIGIIKKIIDYWNSLPA